MIISNGSSGIFPQSDSNSANKVRQFVDATTESKKFFAKKLQSIEEYIELLGTRQFDIKGQETIWDKNFISNELKVAMYINYHLIRLFRDQEVSIQKLTQQIAQNSSRSKKGDNQMQPKSSENKQDESNKITPRKKSQAKSAFGAQKKILSAKHQKQCEQYKKHVCHLQQNLKNNRQQNDYLRGQLLLISDKMTHLANIIELMKIQKQQLEQERGMLLAKVKQSQLKVQTGIYQHLKHLNCSPIVKDNENIDQEEDEVSFSHEYFIESHIETKLLKKHIEELQSQLRVKTQENQVITRKMKQLNQTIAKMEPIVNQESLNKLNMDNIILEYKQIKEQLSSRLIQIEGYRKIVQEIKNTSTWSIYHKQQDQKFNDEIVLKEQLIEVQKCEQTIPAAQGSNEKCQNCYFLTAINQKINLQLQDLREKLNSLLKYQLSQRKQWDIFLHQMNISNDT